MIDEHGGPLTDMGTQNLRAALTTAGFWWLPEITGGKMVPKPYSDWRERTEPFDPAQSYSNAYGLLLNTALSTLGLATFDLDLDDTADAAAALALMSKMFGTPRCVRTRANSPRCAVLYRCDDPAGLSATHKGTDGAIELFCGPRCKITAFGHHIDKTTGLRTRLTWYEVPGNVTRQELPAITLAQSLEFLTACSDIVGEDPTLRQHVPGQHGEPNRSALASDIDELVIAAGFIPITQGSDWNSWNRIGLALYSGSGGDDRGLLAFAEFTRRACRHRDPFTRWDKYKTTPPTRIGAATIFHFALNNGYRRSRAAFTPLDQAARRASRALATFNPPEI
jgi:Primase C terminal 2 (PriCT-2)